MAKDRKHKKYRPKSRLLPSFFYKCSPVTDAEIVNMAVASRVNLEVLASDEPTIESTFDIEGAVHHGFVLAAAFENKSEHQLLFLMAAGAMVGARNEIREGLKEIRMYAVWNGDEWFTEQALPLPIDQFCLAYRRWIKDYEE